MKDIAIYGAGGFGREVACLIKLINKSTPAWNIIGFFDDGKDIGTHNEYGEILGGIEELNNWDRHIDVAIAIGRPNIVKRIVGSITNKNVSFPNIIAPSTIFLDKENIVLGRGNIICSRSLFSCNIKIGDFNIFNGYVTIGHDTSIGNFNSLMPAVRISGDVSIGDCNFFGVDAVVLQQIRIGNETTIGANSLIVRKTKDGNTYIGNPAAIL